MQCGSDNRVEFEVCKTEVLLFSRRRKVLQAARSVVVRIGEQSFAIKQEATKWLGFWLYSKPSFKTHFVVGPTNEKALLINIVAVFGPYVILSHVTSHSIKVLLIFDH